MSRAFYIPEDAPPGKAAILQAALQLFTARGLNGTTIRDIAEAAGVSNPALYKHFASKEDVALQLFVACYKHLVARTERALATEATPEGKVRAYVDAFVKAFDECEQAIIFVSDHLRELWPHASRELAGPNMVTQVEGLVRTLRGGRTSRLDNQVIVAAILGTLGQCARFAHFGEMARPAERWKKQLVELVLKLVQD